MNTTGYTFFDILIACEWRGGEASPFGRSRADVEGDTTWSGLLRYIAQRECEKRSQSLNPAAGIEDLAQHAFRVHKNAAPLKLA